MSTEKTQDESLRTAFRQFHYELHIAECPAEKIMPPKYTVQLMGGDSKSWYHDEESIKAAPDEEKKAWAAYQERLKELHGAEHLAKEDTQESEYEDRRLELLRIFNAYEKHVGSSELALRLMFIEAQYQLGRALTWPG